MGRFFKPVTGWTVFRAWDQWLARRHSRCGKNLAVDARHLVFYRVDVTSGKAEPLLSTKADWAYYRFNDPELSADGRTIFYIDAEDRNPSRQLMRFDLDSRRETILKRGPLVSLGVAVSPDERKSPLAISPDDTQIAYLSAEGLVVAPAIDGERRELVPLSGASDPYEQADGLGGLAWSRDQRYLFFVKPEIRAVWRVPLAGGEAENIGVSMNRIRGLRMHPDGRRLAFDSVIDAPSELWVLENFLPKTGAAR